jgi:uncharacterized protein (DUF362 family)
LKNKVDELLRALSFAVGPGQKVLLKPNLVAAAGGDGLAVTHPRVVRAVAEWCCDHGAVVSVGDSPAFGSGAMVMARCGMTAALAGLPVTIAPFSRQQRLTTASGLSVMVAADIFDHDLLINLPRLKAHGQLRVTMAVKNYFGVVVAWRKAMAHMRHGGGDGSFVRLLVDLLELLPDGVSVIDGIVAMHRGGPLAGEPLPVGVLGASENPVALDTAMLAVIGLLPELSPLWVECARRRLPGSRFAELRFPLAQPTAVAVAGFVVPEILDPIRFHGWRFLRNSIKKVFKGLGKK